MRWLAKAGRPREQNMCNAWVIMNESWSQYANTLQPAAKKRYKAKLEYDDGAGSLPDPYFVKTGWQKDPSTWPDLTFGDIYHYVINTPGIFSQESMKAYKSLDAYRSVNSFNNPIY